MKRLYLSLALGLGLLACCANSPVHLPPRSATNVFRLLAPTRNVAGTGFPVATWRNLNGTYTVVLLTAAHVGYPELVQFDDGRTKVFDWRRHAQHDVALVWTIRTEPVSVTPLAHKLPEYGDRLYAVGFSDPYRRVTEGFAGSKVGAMSVALAFGFSGGPVLNEDGDAVGVATAVMSVSGQTAWFVSYYIPLFDSIQGWIKETIRRSHG